MAVDTVRLRSWVLLYEVCEQIRDKADEIRKGRHLCPVRSEVRVHAADRASPSPSSVGVGRAKPERSEPGPAPADVGMGDSLQLRVQRRRESFVVGRPPADLRRCVPLRGFVTGVRAGLLLFSEVNKRSHGESYRYAEFGPTVECGSECRRCRP